ncbi:hypothetical protein ACP4OV_016958 [Aristida adscensionis]
MAQDDMALVYSLQLTLLLAMLLGDKDIGTCATLDRKFVHHRAKHLPALDSSGCGAFEISNVSFVSLNAVALLCGTNALRFDVEKVMERESHHFQTERVNEAECFLWDVKKERLLLTLIGGKTAWNLDQVPSFCSIFHCISLMEKLWVFPHFHRELRQMIHRFCQARNKANARRLYDQSLTLPANSTQYILQALKPRIIFNAHAGSFSEFVHADGTREVTVPAMTWKTGGVPGFVIATFGARLEPEDPDPRSNLDQLDPCQTGAIQVFLDLSDPWISLERSSFFWIPGNLAPLFLG